MALNAAWVRIDGPIRSVSNTPAPNTRPARNRPGYSTGLGWTSANQGDVMSNPATPADRRRDRTLQQAPVDELLDDRRTDHDHEHEQDDGPPVGLVGELLGALLELGLRERVRPELAQRYVDEGDDDELPEHTDGHADQIDRAESQRIVRGGSRRPDLPCRTCDS